MRIFSLLGAVAAVLLLAVPASAGERLTSCYVGGGAAYSIAVTEASANVPGLGAVASVDGLSADGWGLFGTLGCDYKFQGNFFVGAFGDFTWDDDTTFDVNSSLATSPVAQLTLEHRWTLGARFGHEFKPGAVGYVLVGYTQAETSSLSSPALAVSYAMPDLEGYVLGAGTEILVRDNVYWTAEYTYSDFGDESINLGFAGATLDLETKLHAVKTGVKYRF